VVNVVDVFIVINAILGNGCAADPGLVSIVPNAGPPGASGLAVTINGRNTSFTNSSSVSLGADITVSNIAATSATVLTANLAIAGNAATGPRTLTVDSLTLANAFTVSPPASVSYPYDSQGRLATATYVGATSITVTYSYDAAGNRTTVVAQ
jgi:YD repeat-containing protein